MKFGKTDRWFVEKSLFHHNVAVTTKITTTRGPHAKSTAVRNVEVEEQSKSMTTAIATAAKMYAHETRLLNTVTTDTAVMRTTSPFVVKRSLVVLVHGAVLVLARPTIVVILRKVQSRVSAPQN